jgi:hypothetical protein
MAPKKLSKPKGAFPKVGGVAGIKFNGKTKGEKFENFMVNTVETTETRKDRFENPSRLYAAARKLGISQKAVKKQIDGLAKEQAKYGAAVEKKTSKMDMEDMMRRSKANAAAKKKATVKKSAATSSKAGGAKKASELRKPFVPAQPQRRKSDAPKARKMGSAGKLKPMLDSKKLTPKKK